MFSDHAITSRRWWLCRRGAADPAAELCRGAAACVGGDRLGRPEPHRGARRPGDHFPALGPPDQKKKKAALALTSALLTQND